MVICTTGLLQAAEALAARFDTNRHGYTAHIGLHAETEDITKALLSAAVQDLAARNPLFSSVIFIADVSDPAAISAALSVGFRQHSPYHSYTKTII